ncbi:hypothetical protein F2Q69_00034512 [Brassica cretica]|uniref:Uncharacterized protein n=1 Tax=Brassica cretica TaxID=69181 RepID=A0A8S9SEZ2_BRACR|nr:hypothetical protein F2Q69_00034512 [Brassica cretica]
MAGGEVSLASVAFLLFFLSLSFSSLCGERRHLLRSVGLFDETAASLWVAGVDDGQRRPLYLFLFSTKENDDISPCFFPLLGERRDLSRSVALFDDKVTSLSVAVVEEGKRRSLSLFLSSPRRKTALSLSGKSKGCLIKMLDPASKASGKKTVDQEKTVNEFEKVWTIKQKDLEAKERLSKMSLLDSLTGKKNLWLSMKKPLRKS